MWVVYDYGNSDTGTTSNFTDAFVHRYCSTVNGVMLVRNSLQGGGLLACTFCPLVLFGSPGAIHREPAYIFLIPFSIFFVG